MRQLLALGLRMAAVCCALAGSLPAFCAHSHEDIKALIVNVENAALYEVSVLENGGASHSRNHLRISLRGAHPNPTIDRYFAARVLHDRRITLKNCSPSKQAITCDFSIDMGRIGVAPIDGLKYLAALQLVQID